MTLKDRVALVTGGSQGIGKAVVRRLLEEGATVAFCARDQDRLLEVQIQCRGRGVAGRGAERD